MDYYTVNSYSPQFWCVLWLLYVRVSSSNAAVKTSLDVTHVLSELELSIQRVKVTTTPDGRVLDLFFITDNM